VSCHCSRKRHATKFYKAQMAEFDTKFAEWTAKPLAQKAVITKPRKPSPVQANFGCFVYSQNCMKRPGGAGCITCQTALQNGYEMTVVHDKMSYDLHATVCDCVACLSPCNVIFMLKHLQPIATNHMAFILDQKPGKKSQGVEVPTFAATFCSISLPTCAMPCRHGHSYCTGW
jgi:hypothetical protein